MTVDEYLETSQVTIDTLRSAFARGCKVFGLDLSTCQALALMLNSRWALTLMLAWMLQEEDKGNHPTTTEVVEAAVKIRKVDEKRSSYKLR